jgi:catechol 2,3-dioxygenase-like lactoylglutathione lyase family enzyme
MELEYKNIISFVWSKNIDASVRFYCDILGFKKAYESGGWVEMSIPGLGTGYMALNLWSRSEELPKNQFITLGVDNLEKLLAHLKANGVEVRDDLIEFYDEGIRMMKFFDPDGNTITAAEIQGQAGCR